MSARKIAMLQDWLSVAEAEKAALAQCLEKLLALKTIKDTQGKTAQYEAEQPLAWEAARSLMRSIRAPILKQELKLVGFLTENGEFFHLPDQGILNISTDNLIESIGEPGQKVYIRAERETGSTATPEVNG